MKQLLKNQLFILGLSLVLVSSLSAQPRPCLDLTADGQVDMTDVELALGSIGPRDALIDSRADVDLTGQVDVVDVVNLARVARGEAMGLLGFSKVSARLGDEVFAQLQGPEIRRVRRVVIEGAGGQQVTVRALPRRGGVVFVMPEIDAGPGGLVTVRMAGPRLEPTNGCKLAMIDDAKLDSDGDGLFDDEDTCPFHFDPMNGDTDFDGLGDFCDNCPADPNPDQRDSNGDGSGDACAPPPNVMVNGLLIEPKPGVDPAMAEVQAEMPHGVLVLTREIDMHIKEDLIAMGVEIVRPLARHAFVVAAEPRAFDVLAGSVWFQALFPFDAELRKIGELRDAAFEPDEILELGVEFHPDVELDDGRKLLEGLDAEIVAEGVDLLDDRGLVRRIACFNVIMLADELESLVRRDAVFTVQWGYRNITNNSNSRQAINVDTLNTAGFNGNGIVLGEWDGGWAAGDGTTPPTPPAGTTHDALDGRVMVRDHMSGFEGFTPPAGCSVSQIHCNQPSNLCSFQNHGTHVAGTMIGDGSFEGGGSGANRGMADQADVISYEWPNSSAELACERGDAILNFNTQAHNNSWGYCPGCSYLADYVAMALDYDTEIRNSPEATEVFSAGNYQTYRINGWNPCTMSSDTPCSIPSVLTPSSCTTPPPGVTSATLSSPLFNTIERFYTVSAPGGTAKNTLVVGNADDVNNRLANSSGMGPTLDGRIKPEVVAHGTSVVSTCVPSLSGCFGSISYVTYTGTSMAAPAVAGALGLIHERAGQLGVTLENADMRALSAHTARDLGTHDSSGNQIVVSGSQWAAFTTVADGPDFMTGYGMLDADEARQHLDAGNIGGTLKPTGCPSSISYASIPFDSPVEVGGAGPVPGCPSMIWDVVWYVTIPSGVNELKVTIAWDDPAGTASSSPALVNDLDLILREPNNVTHHYSWWLDPACPYRQAARVSANSWNAAVYGDHVNNLEQVHVIGGVTPGQWKIIIRTSGLASGSQPFSMMVSTN